MSWKHEWDSDLDNEKRIVAKLHEMWNCESSKMQGFSYADFI